MPRPYVDRKNKRLGKRIDFDKWAGYQCVDLFKLYMKEVLGTTIGHSWSAKQIWSNKYHCFDAQWKQIKGTKDLIQWDIVCFLFGKYWHIGIIDTIGDFVCVLEQNWSGKNPGSWTGENAIRVHPYAPSSCVGVWRCKKIQDNLAIEIAFIDEKLTKVNTDIDNTMKYKDTIAYKA
jgi:hypothetical protein